MGTNVCIPVNEQMVVSSVSPLRKELQISTSSLAPLARIITRKSYQKFYKGSEDLCGGFNDRSVGGQKLL